MEGVHLKGGGGGAEPRPQLLDLILSKRDWMVRDRGGGVDVGNGAAAAVVGKELELRLGPPGGGDVGLSAAGGGSRDSKMVVAGEPCSVLSLGGLFSSRSRSCSRSGGSNLPWAGAKRGFLDTLEDSEQQAHKTGFFGAGACKEEEEEAAAAAAAHKGGDGADDGNAEKQAQHRPGEKKAATSPAPCANAAAANDRTSQAPVVGWPPIRSFRKNIAAASSSSSSKPPPKGSIKSSRLVKINMDGVPIGRKVDLSVCSSYDRLSAAVDQLFRGLLAAQRVINDHGSSSGSFVSSAVEQHESSSTATAGLLDGSGEYMLVYEDNEGDRMLVGDVPWEMFVSTVKRLRVLKSSELPSLSLGVAGGATRTRKAPSPPAGGQGAAA